MTGFPALPARPLYAHPPAARVSGFFGVLGWLFGLVALGAMVWAAGPDLYTDWQVRDTAAQVRGGHLASGTCHSQLVFHICDATLTAPNRPGQPQFERSVNFAFASFNFGDFEAMVVADPRRPELLTTDLALDHFWDRVMTLLVLVGLVLLLLGWGIVQYVRRRRDMRLWRTSPAVPTVLRLHTITRHRTGRTWSVLGEGGAKANWTVSHRAAAFTLGAPARILGLRRVVDGAIMPLDAKLRWVDLSDAERAAALTSAVNPAATAA